MASDANALSTAAQVPARRGRLLTIDNRFLPPILITCILVGANLSFGILEGWERTALAIVVAIGTELVLGRITYGKWPHPASAYISGISAGILIRSPFWWPYFFTQLHLDPFEVRAAPQRPAHLESDQLRRQRHGVPGAGDGDGAQHSVGQRRRADGGHLDPWCGDRVACRARSHLGDLRRRVLPVFIRPKCRDRHPWLAAVAPITGPMYQLFIFFMITDPKTTVRSKRGQCVVVVLVAFVEMLMRLAEIVYAPFYALFLVGSVAMIVEIRRDTRAKLTRPTPV